MRVCAYLSDMRTSFVSVVSHHSADHPAEVDRVSSKLVVSVLVAEVLRADLQELQTRLQDPGLILHTWRHTCSRAEFLPEK